MIWVRWEGGEKRITFNKTDGFHLILMKIYALHTAAKIQFLFKIQFKYFKTCQKINLNFRATMCNFCKNSKK